MFIKFEGKDSEHTTQVDRYTVLYEDDHTSVITFVGEKSEEYILSQDGAKNWHRMYAMNDNGKTIATAHCPEV